METRVKRRSTKKGLHLPENKITSGKEIEKFPLPGEVIIPLRQHIGAPCECLISRGDIVKTGQKIADRDTYVTAPIHSPISGRVSKIIKIINPADSSLIDAMVITSDGEDLWVDLDKKTDINIEKDKSFKELFSIIESMAPEDILKIIKERGIVGLGGATFPTHVKLNPPENKKIDTVILNGCECEPFITTDHRLLLEYGEKILMGLYIIDRIISPEKIYIGIEDNKRDAIEHIKKLLVEMKFPEKYEIVSLKSRYPMGAEKTLINAIDKRRVPMGGLPMDVGVIVSNVGTVKAIYEGVIEGKPLIDRIVTVTGKVKDPKNLLVRMGTPINDLIEYCGGLEEDANELVFGGPMMGISIDSVNYSITKSVNCLLLKKSKYMVEQNCIRCARCIDICPMDLEPLAYVRLAKNGMNEKCKDYHIDNCIECGSCAFVCPAKIPIVGYIKTVKSTLRKDK